ncbi:MAG: hypothetical protein ACTTKN_06345 [Phocaeicola sp.]|uniref:hypothetical protein n=1 Tax=Phocaeicola TaxID=909656 RepID=UPI00234F154F|nr:hypothetical protein [Phocaeicola oris]MCE2616567.1 hypothetical protein [Phocaeicola oris]
MAKNKPTPLKDEPVMSLDDICTKLDELTASIGALQKEPCEPVVPKVNIQVKGLHFKTEEEFHEKVILLYKGLGIYSQEQEDAYIKELHDKGELSNREMLQAIHKKTCAIPDDNNHVPNSLKDQLIHRWHKIKECIHIVFYEPSNKWYRNVYAWISIILTLMFTIYEVVNVKRLKAYNEDLQTIAAQHQMTREIIRELQPDLFVTITSFDDMVQSKGYSYAHEHFENNLPKEKPKK